MERMKVGKKVRMMERIVLGSMADNHHKVVGSSYRMVVHIHRSYRMAVRIHRSYHMVHS